MGLCRHSRPFSALHSRISLVALSYHDGTRKSNYEYSTLRALYHMLRCSLLHCCGMELNPLRNLDVLQAWFSGPSQ